MAGFKTHITVSTVLGVGYAAGAHFVYGVPPSTCIVAGGLCSLAGMLPDLDSDSGVPVREMISLVAAAVPMLMLNRFQHLGWTEEAMACAAIVIYCIIRFGVAAIFKKLTVHRGMWHSVPACAVAGILTFLIVSGEDYYLRLYKSLAVVLGFMSHLVLDEIWSFQVGVGGVRIKRSFGTAIKFWNDNLWANVSVYAKLVIVSLFALGDPVLMERFDLGDHHAPQFARNVFDGMLGKIEQATNKLEQGPNWRLVPREETPPPLEPVVLPANTAPPARAQSPALPPGPLPGEPIPQASQQGAPRY